MEDSKFKDWTDAEIIPISALSHYVYCPRQYALIHIEGVFVHNRLTMGGKIGHEVVDQEASFNDHGLRKETSLRVYSDALGLTGIADVVEFPSDGPPFPVDYKHGHKASWQNHEVQLCAIALCLEEMFDLNIPQGAIYHLYSKKRHTVNFSSELIAKTKQAIEEVRSLAVNQTLPAAQYSSKCDNCSLRSVCLPEFTKPQHQSIFVPMELL